MPLSAPPTVYVVSPVAPVRSTRLEMLTDGGQIEAYVDSDDASAIKDLLDAEVEVTGIAAGKFDDKMQQTGVVLYVSSLAEITILHRSEERRVGKECRSRWS